MVAALVEKIVDALVTKLADPEFKKRVTQYLTTRNIEAQLELVQFSYEELSAMGLGVDTGDIGALAQDQQECRILRNKFVYECVMHHVDQTVRRKLRPFTTIQHPMIDVPADARHMFCTYAFECNKLVVKLTFMSERTVRKNFRDILKPFHIGYTTGLATEAENEKASRERMRVL